MNSGKKFTNIADSRKYVSYTIFVEGTSRPIYIRKSLRDTNKEEKKFIQRLCISNVVILEVLNIHIYRKSPQHVCRFLLVGATTKTKLRLICGITRQN